MLMYLVLGLYVGFYIGFLVAALLSASKKAIPYKNDNRIESQNFKRPTNTGKPSQSKCPERVDAESIHEAIQHGEDTQVY